LLCPFGKDKLLGSLKNLPQYDEKEGMFQALIFSFFLLTAQADEPACEKLEELEIKALSDSITKVEKAIQCGVNVTCADSKPFLEAQQAVDADLMADWLAKRGKLKGTIVAVIDSGFDAARIQAGDIRIEETRALRRGPATEDEFGHRTAVSSLISGRDGIGVSPNARVRGLRITNRGEQSAIGALLKAKALDACREGAEVINVSFGAITPFEEDKRFIKELSERGCFVVKAAGNMGIEQVLSENSWDRRDAVLRVDGINPRNGRRHGNFDRGEWSAPGVELTTLAPVGAARTVKCGDIEIQRNSGSSGAAPIVSAIVAETLSVLREAAWYADLAAPARVELVTHILDAARQPLSGLSGYLAIRIAGSLADNKELDAKQLEAAVKTAHAGLKSDAICEIKPSCAKEQRLHDRICKK
jgi:subtilisin family serine protease